VHGFPSSKLNSSRLGHLGDGNLSALVLLGLRHPDSEDAVLHGGFDAVLVHASGEAEGTSELPNSAFRNPVLGLILWLLGLLFLLFLFLGRDGGAVVIGGFLILDGGFVAVVLLTTLSDGAGGLGTLNKIAGRCAGLVCSLGAATNRQGLGVRELDFDVLLINTRKFTVQLVCVGKLPDIEFGGEGLHMASMVMSITATGLGVGVEVLEKTEERSEGWVRAHEGARK